MFLGKKPFTKVPRVQEEAPAVVTMSTVSTLPELWMGQYRVVAGVGQDLHSLLSNREQEVWITNNFSQNIFKGSLF